ncbi:MAG: membrane protein insertion efficiency factor YidD [Leptospiraceae bacterium]|nr:membrane protein insertion efficiency factor YidD [Leptospiraceae bacterium]
MNKAFKIIFYLIFCVFFLNCGKSSDETIQIYKPIDFLLEKHKSESTHYDGPRCPFYPSCAAYGKKAINKHPLLAPLLIIDRLFFREGGNFDEKYMKAPSRLSKDIRYFDPIEENIINFDSELKASLYEENFDRLR